MTEATSTDDPFAADAAAVAAAVDEIEAMRAAERKRALAKAGAALVIGVAAVVFGLGIGGGTAVMIGVVAGIACLIAAIVVLSSAGARVRTALAERVMPILCRMAGGFEYAREGSPDATLSEAKILPPGNKQRSGDEVRGEIGGVAFRSWDVRVAHETRDSEGKTRTQTLFRGLVVTAGTGTGRDLAVHLPRVSVTQFLSKLFGRGGRVATTGITAAGTEYEVDAHPGEFDLAALARAVETLLAALPDGARFEGVLQREGEATIAVHTGRDHYAMGGLFTSRDKLMGQVEAAMGDLALPARIAGTWAGAEARVPAGDPADWPEPPAPVMPEMPEAAEDVDKGAAAEPAQVAKSAEAAPSGRRGRRR